MDLVTAEKHIKRAWIIGIISGSLTLLLLLMASLGNDMLQGMGLDLWSLLDVALVFGLTYGIYRKSRICAIVLFSYFILSKIYTMVEMGQLGSLAISALFLYFLFQGIRGTWAYHKLQPRTVDDTPRPPRRKLMWIIIASTGGFVGLVLGILVYIGLVGPEIEVVPGAQMNASYLSQINELGLLEEDESIIYFYSDGLLDIEEGFYFFSDNKVVIYRASYDEPAIVIEYTQIIDMSLYDTDSFFEDSRITLELSDGTAVWFPVSNEAHGDEKFYKSLRATWERNIGPEDELPSPELIG